MRARIESCTNSRVQEIVLAMPDSFGFRAGQYLEIELPGDQRIPLSIASAPHRLPELHLHYQSTAGAVAAELFDELLASGRDLTVHGPSGNVWVEPPLAEALLMVAGGTGAAQAMGLLDALVNEPPSQPVTLLWCADDEDQLYRRKWLQSLNVSWLTSQCIVDTRRDATNRGMTWLRDHADVLRDHRIILSGGLEFVNAAAAALMAAGIERTRLASDMFGNPA